VVVTLASYYTDIFLEGMRKTEEQWSGCSVSWPRLKLGTMRVPVSPERHCYTILLGEGRNSRL
jgi:hypothetical protein